MVYFIWFVAMVEVSAGTSALYACIIFAFGIIGSGIAYWIASRKSGISSSSPAGESGERGEYENNGREMDAQTNDHDHSWFPGSSLSPSKGSLRVLSLGTVFGGGAFMGAGFIHIIADADAGRSEDEFPWALLFSAIGAYLTMCVEVAAEYIMSKGRGDSTEANSRGERLLAANHHGHSHDFAASYAVNSAMSPVMACVLWCALSFHSLLAGLALGAETIMANQMGILIAIVAHKVMAAFAIASALLRSRVRIKVFCIATGAFSLMTPLGVAIGAAVSSASKFGFGTLVMSSLAGGTFVYVSIAEIIVKELHDGNDKGLKVLLIGAGIGLMALVAKWA